MNVVGCDAVVHHAEREPATLSRGSSSSLSVLLVSLQVYVAHNDDELDHARSVAVASTAHNHAERLGNSRRAKQLSPDGVLRLREKEKQRFEKKEHFLLDKLFRSHSQKIAGALWDAPVSAIEKRQARSFTWKTSKVSRPVCVRHAQAQGVEKVHVIRST